MDTTNTVMHVAETGLFPPMEERSKPILDEETGRRIFHQVSLRLATLGIPAPHKQPVPAQTPIPDVVIVADDHALLFEPKNLRAAEWLHRRCNLSFENTKEYERIRVHPCLWHKVLDDLKEAGFRVLY